MLNNYFNFLLQATSNIIITLSAPSGVGKTTVVKELLKRNKNMDVSISYTTRKKASSELNGKDYFFISKTEFDLMVNKGDFVEYAKVFDNWYGTSKNYLDKLIKSNKNVVLEIDWQGAMAIKKRFFNAVNIIMVSPDNIKELEARFKQRGRDNDAVIKKRIKAYRKELIRWRDFDFLIINESLEKTVEEIENIIEFWQKRVVNLKNNSGKEIGLLDLTGTNLREIDLSGADLQGINLNNADLTGTNLQKAYIDVVKGKKIYITKKYLKEQKIKDYNNVFSTIKGLDKNEDLNKLSE